MEKHRRLLTKLELGIEVGYVTVPLELERAYRLYQAQNTMKEIIKVKHVHMHKIRGLILSAIHSIKTMQKN